METKWATIYWKKQHFCRSYFILLVATVIIDWYTTKLKKFCFSVSHGIISHFKWLSWKHNVIKTFFSLFSLFQKENKNNLYTILKWLLELSRQLCINDLLFWRLSYWRTSVVNRRWNAKICSSKTLSLPCILWLYALIHF